MLSRMMFRRHTGRTQRRQTLCTRGQHLECGHENMSKKHVPSFRLLCVLSFRTQTATTLRPATSKLLQMQTATTTQASIIYCCYADMCRRQQRTNLPHRSSCKCRRQQRQSEPSSISCFFAPAAQIYPKFNFLLCNRM